MFLVHKKNKRKWEVAWMWLPHFLAADLKLVNHVDQRLTEIFKGKSPDLDVMHYKVIDLIMEKYSIKGLRDYLEAIAAVGPEEAEKM